MIDQTNQNYVIIISGPTGAGKSDFVSKLSNKTPIEVINADIGSLYTPLTIGTAKPDWRNASAPHHFFDIFDTPESWTAPAFREKLEILLHQIWQRGNIPVIVGGSAFYIQSFFYKNHELLTPAAALVAELEQLSSELLWQQLDDIDPVRAQAIDPSDHYRLVRALAIWHTQKCKPSQFTPIFAPLAPFYCMTLTRERDELYTMINRRVDAMLQAGWLNEVCQVAQDPDWKSFLEQKKMIGYDLLLAYDQSSNPEKELDEVAGLIAQKTRNYAKRQITFLKRLHAMVGKAMKADSSYADWMGVLQEFDLGQENLDLLLDTIVGQAFFK